MNYPSLFALPLLVFTAAPALADPPPVVADAAPNDDGDWLVRGGAGLSVYSPAVGPAPSLSVTLERRLLDHLWVYASVETAGTVAGAGAVAEAPGFATSAQHTTYSSGLLGGRVGLRPVLNPNDPLSLYGLVFAAAGGEGAWVRTETTALDGDRVSESFATGVTARGGLGVGVQYALANHLVAAAQLESVASLVAPGAALGGFSRVWAWSIEPQLTLGYRF